MARRSARASSRCRWSSILVKALQDTRRRFRRPRQLRRATSQTPALLQSLWNSVWVSALVTLITVPLAFVFAYALTRSCMPFKALLRTIALIPLLAPSLLSAISFIYWFGNQGALQVLDGVGIARSTARRGIVLSPSASRLSRMR